MSDKEKRDSGTKESPEEEEAKEGQAALEAGLSEEDKEILESSGQAAKDNRKKEK